MGHWHMTKGGAEDRNTAKKVVNVLEPLFLSPPWPYLFLMTMNILWYLFREVMAAVDTFLGMIKGTPHHLYWT